MPAAGPEKKPKTHDSEGTIEVEDHDDAAYIDPIMAEYGLEEPEKFRILQSSLLQREWVPDDHARKLGINRRTYNQWKTSAVAAIQQRIDDKELLKKLGAE